MEKFIGNEIIYLHSPNINVCFKVRIDINLPGDVFQNAVKIVEHKHPMLKYVIKTNSDKRKYYEASGGVSIQFYTTDETDWQKWRDEADNIPFKFENESLVKIAIIQGNGYADIVFLGHHILGDGIGYLNLVRDFLCALDGKTDNIVLELPTKNQLKKKYSGFLLKLFANSLNKQWGKTNKTFTYTEYVGFFKQYRSENPAKVYLVETDKEFLSKLKMNSKERGITINEAIATAFVRAIQSYNGENTIHMGCAASIRNELDIPIPYHMGNCVTGISVKIKNAQDTPIKLREQLSNPKKRYQVIHLFDKLQKPLIESVMYAAYGNYENPVSQKLAETLNERKTKKSFGISNLGVQDFEGFSFKVSDVWFVNPAFPQNFLTVGFITIDGIIKFCLHYSEMTETQIVNIYNKFKELV